MFSNLRLALLVDPLSARAPSATRVQAVRHARELSQAMEARGHTVELFGLAAEDGHRGPRLAAFEPDAILAYDALSPAAWHGSRMARRLRLPLVLVEAGSFAEGSWTERAAWRMGELLWGSFVRRTAGSIVALDPVARDQALREGFLPERVHVVPHGADTERFRPGLVSDLVRKHRIRGRILLHLGPLDARSGTQTLIQAFARSLGQRDDWSLVLVSRHARSPRIRACADRHGVGARVHILHLEEEDLPSLVSCSTLVAHPARDDAPVGGAVARAFACGRPVLASDLPRLRYLVEPAGAGLFARAGDVEDWTRVLRQAASAPEARKRWSRGARRASEEEFDWTRVAERVEEILDEAEQRVPRGAPPSRLSSASVPAERAG